jgi:hypothetical protein
MFDSKTREDFFDEIWASWPKDWRAVDFKERAKDLFRSFVENEDWLKTFQEAFDAEKPKVTLTVFIRNLAKKHDKPLGAKSTVQCNTLKELNPVVSGVKTDPKLLEIFQEVRAVWPVNSDYPESLEAAKKAWFLACETTPVEDLRDATLAYCEDWDTGKLQSRHPYLMKNFVVNEERLEEWLFKAKHKPRPEEREIFEVFWGWYPTFEKKADKEIKDDSFHYFNRMVKPEEYWAFMIALRAYRSERRDRIFEDDSEEVGKYTRGFIKFIKDWDSTSPRTAETIEELVLKDFLAACIKYGIDRAHVWIEELGGHIQNIQINNVDGISTPRNVRETVKETLRRMCDFDGQKVVLDLDKVTEEILANAWKRSCKPKAKVVELDSL